MRLEKKQLLAIREKVASLLVDVELIPFMNFLICVIIVQFAVLWKDRIYSLSCTIGGCF